MIVVLNSGSVLFLISSMSLASCCFFWMNSFVLAFCLSFVFYVLGNTYTWSYFHYNQWFQLSIINRPGAFRVLCSFSDGRPCWCSGSQSHLPVIKGTWSVLECGVWCNQAQAFFVCSVLLAKVCPCWVEGSKMALTCSLPWKGEFSCTGVQEALTEVQTIYPLVSQASIRSLPLPCLCSHYQPKLVIQSSCLSSPAFARVSELQIWEIQCNAEVPPDPLGEVLRHCGWYQFITEK